MGKKYYKAHNYQITKYLRLAGLLCIVGGIGVFVYFFFPLVAYQLFLGAPIQTQEIESPVPKYLIGRSSNIRSLIDQGISRLQFDYKDARNWYPQVHAEEKTVEKVNNYLLSIPTLGIDNANVSTNNYNLSETLVHYYGPANPLDHGTSVIFGHSTLPQWFNPTNYEAIFATLHTIQIGDELIVTVNGEQHTYEIFATTITTPDDVNIFSQSYDNSYITLVTCTPPGTIWKRLIVRAVLKT
ncbi:MAG TPA: sortase [Candidatus Levybacteria bacterium]|nr:sortase [Candidatus Levybacteria bacterium]